MLDFDNDEMKFGAIAVIVAGIVVLTITLCIYFYNQYAQSHPLQTCTTLVQGAMKTITCHPYSSGN